MHTQAGRAQAIDSLSTEEIARLDIAQIRTLFRNFSEDNIYNFERHLRLAEDLGRNRQAP